MSKQPIWHGLTFEQWLKMWDHEGWREEVTSTLLEIAADERASTLDRLAALQTYNDAILAGALPEDSSYPELMTEVLLDLVSRASKVSWWSRRRRKRLHARLVAAQWMLKTSYQFIAHVAQNTEARAAAAQFS